MKTLYFALCEARDGTYFVTNTVYESESDAEKELGDCFVTLVRGSYPFHLNLTELGRSVLESKKEIDPSLKKYLPKVKIKK